MNKIFCNKETNMVEQIINIDIDKNFSEDWFPNCYVVDDPENNINAYNLKYNKDLEVFEVVQGLNPKDEIVIEESEEKNKIKQLTEELELTQNALNEILMNLGGI